MSQLFAKGGTEGVLTNIFENCKFLGNFHARLRNNYYFRVFHIWIFIYRYLEGKSRKKTRGRKRGTTEERKEKLKKLTLKQRRIDKTS